MPTLVCSISQSLEDALYRHSKEAGEPVSHLVSSALSRTLGIEHHNSGHLLSPHSGGDLIVEENRSGSITDQRLARVIEYMQANYARTLSIEDLSHKAGISKFHFVTVFRKEVGITPHRYLIELRLNKAASLLRTSQSTIEQIACACGYGDAAQFSTAFTRYFNKTPSFFRKEVSGKPGMKTNLLDIRATKGPIYCQS
jgi:transcriptional regulator GlxA family with amidase domain